MNKNDIVNVSNKSLMYEKLRNRTSLKKTTPLCKRITQLRYYSSKITFTYHATNKMEFVPQTTDLIKI